MKPTLLILAAGMGSRYGGIKQMDEFGPSGETIIDYSIYDAIQSGFGKLEGKSEGKLEIAKALKEIGISIDIIIKTTGLSENEINKL